MGDGKGGAKDNSKEMYEKQQADLARTKSENDLQARAAREDEQKRKDELRRQMLGNRNASLGYDEDAEIQKNVLG